MSFSNEKCIFCNKTNCKIIQSTKHFFIITYVKWLIAIDSTAPPFALKYSLKSEPPPNKLTLKGDLDTIIIKFFQKLNY